MLGITFGICLATWIACYTAFEWMSTAFPFLPHEDSPHLVAMASLGATLMMTRSPASAIAVLKEMEGTGPFCSLVMAVVVVSGGGRRASEGERMWRNGRVCGHRSEMGG